MRAAALDILLDILSPKTAKTVRKPGQKHPGGRPTKRTHAVTSRVVSAVSEPSVNGTKKHEGGRPTKRTPDRETLLLKAIAKGLPLKVACMRSSLSFTTFNDWRHTDSSFAQKVECAEAKAIARLLARIEKAAQKDWRAGAWLLERRHPEMFARPEVQLNLQLAANPQHDNLSVWLHQPAALPAPKETHMGLPFEIGDLELICDAEADAV
jgi:hypothetical protein